MVRKIRYALLGLLVLSVCGAGAMVGFAENAPAPTAPVARITQR